MVLYLFCSLPPLLQLIQFSSVNLCFPPAKQWEEKWMKWETLLPCCKPLTFFSSSRLLNLLLSQTENTDGKICKEKQKSKTLAKTLGQLKLAELRKCGFWTIVNQISLSAFCVLLSKPTWKQTVLSCAPISPSARAYGSAFPAQSCSD